jgi:hypothetical protein
MLVTRRMFFLMSESITDHPLIATKGVIGVGPNCLTGFLPFGQKGLISFGRNMGRRRLRSGLRRLILWFK